MPISGAGSLLVVIGDKGVGVFDERSGKTRFLAPDATGGVMSPNGAVLITDQGDVFEVASGKKAGTGTDPVGLDPVPAFSADGNRVAYVPVDELGAGRHPVVVHDFGTGNTVRGEFAGRVDDLELNDDGTRLALRGEAGPGPHAAPEEAPVEENAASPLSVVDVTGRWRPMAGRTLAGPGPVHFGRENQLLVHDGQGVLALDVGTLSGGADPYTVDAVDQWSFSRDGSQVAVVRGCGVDLVDPVTWTTVASLPEVSREVEGGCAEDPALLWRSDGRLLTAGRTTDFEATVSAWDTDPGTLVTRVCQLAGRNMSRTEYAQFVPGFDYRETCPQYAEHPADGSDATQPSTSSRAALTGSSSVATPTAQSTAARTATTTSDRPASDVSIPSSTASPSGRGPEDGWVAQLFSVPDQDRSNAETRQREARQRLGIEVQLLRSSDYISLSGRIWKSLGGRSRCGWKVGSVVLLFMLVDPVE